jgi:hypothetical protein
LKHLVFLLSCYCFLFIEIHAQTTNKRNQIWTISDSTGIDFSNSLVPIPFNNNSLQVPFGGTFGYASIADSTGNLLLYTDGRRIWGANNSLCLNGDTFACTHCHNSSFFLPSQLDTTFYYFFRTWDVNAINNLELIKIKMYLNNNCEQVSFQWKQLCGTYCSRKMIPIKHGNGSDFWILSFSRDNAQYCRMLFSNDSLYTLGNDSLENAYTNNQTGAGSLVDVSFDGSKIVLAFNNNDTTDVCVYNFDRCTGFISFDKRIFYRPDAYQNQTDFFWAIRETVFSNDNKYVYAMTWDTIYQLSATLDWTQQIPLVIWYDTNHVDYNDYVVMVAMERAPDGRIYVSRDRAPNNSTFPDSINRYLGVIDSIDNAYPSAHFIRKGFYLGGRQARGGLVQNVNYDLGPWIGSPCDTLITTGISEQSTKPKITLAPNPAHTQATLTWSGMQEGTFVLRDMLGRAMLREQLNAPYGTTRFDLSTLPKGIYLWQVHCATYSKNGKLVVE